METSSEPRQGLSFTVVFGFGILLNSGCQGTRVWELNGMVMNKSNHQTELMRCNGSQFSIPFAHSSRPVKRQFQRHHYGATVLNIPRCATHNMPHIWPSTTLYLSHQLGAETRNHEAVHLQSEIHPVLSSLSSYRASARSPHYVVHLGHWRLPKTDLLCQLFSRLFIP